MPVVAEHYFNEQPTVASSPRLVPLHLADLAFELTTDRGVFSGEQIDAGTRVLLTEAVRLSGPMTVLDLGCGYGPIACAAATRNPQARVLAIDVNDRALALCASNAEQLGLRNVEACRAEAVDTELRFDRIISNPPIRVGKKVLHSLLTTWLDRLAPGGHGELVVHKNLGSDSLQRWLNEQGWATERLISRAGYRVLIVASRDSSAQIETHSDPALGVANESEVTS